MVNGDAPAWTVGQWSTCTCFEQAEVFVMDLSYLIPSTLQPVQCMPGLRTRIVQCGGSVCRQFGIALYSSY